MRKDMQAPRVSELSYQLLVTGGVGLSAWLSTAGLFDTRLAELLYVTWVFSIPAFAAGCLLLYRCWQVIQDGQARTTPIQAVVYLLVPVFNLYWLFPAVAGFSADYNRYLQRHRLVVPSLSVPLYAAFSTALALNIVLIFVPYVNYGLFLLVVTLTFFVVRGNCRAINQLAYAGFMTAQSPLGPVEAFRQLPQAHRIAVSLGLLSWLILGLGGLFAAVFHGKAREAELGHAILSRRMERLAQEVPTEEVRRRLAELERNQQESAQAIDRFWVRFSAGLAVVGIGLICGAAASAILVLGNSRQAPQPSGPSPGLS